MSIPSIAATSVIGIVAEVYFLWIFYLAVMNLKRARDAGTISRVALVLGCPVLAVGYVFDLAVNITVCSLLVWDWPREATVSAHLARLVRTGTPYQRTVSRWLAVNLLDAFDPSGNHLGG